MVELLCQIRGAFNQQFVTHKSNLTRNSFGCNLAIQQLYISGHATTVQFACHGERFVEITASKFASDQRKIISPIYVMIFFCKIRHRHTVILVQAHNREWKWIGCVTIPTNCCRIDIIQSYLSASYKKQYVTWIMWRVYVLRSYSYVESI